MKKRILALLTAAVMSLSLAACNKEKNNDSSAQDSTSSSALQEAAENTESASDSGSAEAATTEPATEAPTKHVSPVENISSTLGSQVTLNKTITREEGANTVSIPLSDLVKDGDSISSFTFVIYSGDGRNIGTYKGGCGISVTGDCSAATDEGWYQSADFSASTEGTYGEIRWDVPAEIRDYISTGGEVLFGYWWGNATSVRVDSVICTYTRNGEIPVDGTVSTEIGKSVDYNDSDNTIKVPLADIVPDGNSPTAVTFNVSSGGSFGKFTGAFGISVNEDCSAATDKGWYQSEDIAVFTESSSLSLTWIIPEELHGYISQGGDLMLGYWWSDQPTVSLDSVSVKYAVSDGSAASSDNSDASSQVTPTAPSGGNQTSNSSPDGSFRSASELVSAINVGWNLGNTLECYDYADYTKNAETAWGNLKTTPAMIESVKNAGFNAVRIPVTWGDHMEGDVIDSAWLDRVQEVVDYAYNLDMFVILNMHHDDYTWFTPSEAEYAADSAKLCSIWKQISERFKGYDDRLLFEGMNEPRTVGSSMEWMGGTPEERAVINKYAQDFVSTVRASGGNNAERALLITSYAASVEKDAINDVVVPDDKNIIVSLHAYTPWSFANGDSKSWSKADVNAVFNRIAEKFTDKGIPVMITEFGAVASNSAAARATYYEYYVSTAASHGVKCFVWDNGLSSGESAFGIFNRGALKWNEEILGGIMNGAN